LPPISRSQACPAQVANKDAANEEELTPKLRASESADVSLGAELSAPVLSSVNQYDETPQKQPQVSGHLLPVASVAVGVLIEPKGQVEFSLSHLPAFCAHEDKRGTRPTDKHTHRNGRLDSRDRKQGAPDVLRRLVYRAITRSVTQPQTAPTQHTRTVGNGSEVRAKVDLDSDAVCTTHHDETATGKSRHSGDAYRSYWRRAMKRRSQNSGCSECVSSCVRHRGTTHEVTSVETVLGTMQQFITCQGYVLRHSGRHTRFLHASTSQLLHTT
jgi:hypothetical protein